ncbi:MAG: 4Fe-4S ferredoxin, partial [Candidatus Methanomethylicota archaeon]
MISNVYFLDFNRMSNTIKEMDKLLEKSIPYIEPGSSIAIKVHIGERGNFTYIRPFFIRKIVDYIKEQKAKPFIAETTVLYPTGYRRNEKEIIETAKYNGFTEEGLGCPIVVADGNDGEDGIEVLSDFPDSPIKSIKVARKIAEANGVIIVSHVKGHV